VWEMINKGVMKRMPAVALGNFWIPVIECVREVEIGNDSRWSEREHPLIHSVTSPVDAASYLAGEL
jgi:hypothetical protein